jgi:hypothetical protein
LDVHRLDEPGHDELAQGGLRNPNMTADANEPDPPFRDQAARKTLACAEQVGHLSDGQ